MAINGSIGQRKTITASVTSGGGTNDHSRLTNREAADQHPIEAITNLKTVLDSKIDSVTIQPIIADIKKDLAEALTGKAKGLYYDAACELNKKPYWYVTSEIDPDTKLGTKSSIISGPYNLGAGGGGGGGGGTTDVTLLKTNPETGESLWPTTVSLNATTEIGVYWKSTRDGQATGSGTMYLYINDVLVSKKAVKQGEVKYDITEYIQSGDNKIEFKVTDAYSTSKNLIGNVTGVSLKLTSTFEDDVSYKGDITYIYTPIGDVTKTVHFIVDGADTGTDVVKSTGEQQTHMIRALSHGAHTLEVYFTAMLDGEEVRSNTLKYDLICYEEGNRTPIIASTFPDESTNEQYVSLAIKFRVYTPGRNTSTVTQLIDGKQIGSLNVDIGWKTWEDRPTVVGSHIYVLKTGNVSRTFKVQVTESTIKVEAVTQNLKLYLTTFGRNNSEDPDVRCKWKDNAQNIDCVMSGFNWSSNGWILDNNGETVLRLSGDARVTIPYKPFENDLQQTGKTIEFEIATTDVKKYEARIVECLTGGDSLTYTYKCAGEDDRPKLFTVTSVDSEKFITKVKGIHRTYLFQHNGTDWILDGAPVNLGPDNDYGIEIVEQSRGEGGSYYINGDRITVAYEVLGRGIYITPQLAKLQSQLSALSTQYKENEKVRLAFVVEKRTENLLICMYINGILSGVTKYPSADTFAQSPAADIVLGSNDATLDVYTIRIYDNSLTRKQVVNNWIADMRDPIEKAVYFQDNDNFDETGKVVVAKLPSKTPYMIVTAPTLPSYKKDKKPVDVEFVYPGQDNRYFRTEGTIADVQGTSSQYYYRKNFKFNYKTGFIDIDGNSEEKYKINPPLSKKEKKFTYKADVASSEGANNVELVRYFEFTKNWDMPAELDQDPEDTQDGYLTKDRIRTGIDGFPIVMFHNNGASTNFYGKMNFNNDKDNKNTFGFSEGDECWEFINNTTPLVLFNTDDMSSWNISFESRYPETAGSDEHAYGTGEGELDKLTRMMQWVYSTAREPIPESATQEEATAIATRNEAKLTKFKREFTNYFDKQSSLFYYLYTELFLMVDSRAKNAMLAYLRSHNRGDGGDRWFWLPYDMDTAIGTNNEGLLVFDYDAEDTDIINGAYVYNGQQSVFWCNLRDAFKSELAALYTNLRSGNAGGEKKWSYDEIEKMFEDHQKVWSASIFNEDAYTKYLEPLILNNDATYLGMAQGSKAEQRKWWLYNRFKYLDSKYRCGDAKDQNIMLRAYTRSNLEITPYINCYVTGVFDQAVDDLMVTVDAERDTKYTIVPPAKWNPKDTDSVVIIYSADLLRDVGDLSGLKPGYADFSAATKLQRLQIGNKADGYSNDKLTILNVGNNHLLTYIDARNCSALGTGDTKVVNLSNCTSIEEVYFDNTNISGVSLPVGGNLKKIHLPGTITDLTIRDHPNITDLTLAGTNKLTSVWLENIPSSVIKARDIINNLADGSLVRIIGMDEQFDSAEQLLAFYNKLQVMKGKDAKGDTLPTAQVTGKARLENISYADYVACMTARPEIEIIAGHVWCNVVFYNGTTIFDTQNIGVADLVIGAPAVDPTIEKGLPQKDMTEQFYYVFTGWDKSFNAINADTNIYAQFSENTRTFDIDFDTQGPATVKNTEKIIDGHTSVLYGELCEVPVLENIPQNVTFVGWFEEDGTEFSFDTPIKKSRILYAHWNDTEAPTLTLSRYSHNKFHYIAEDNLGISKWAVVKEEETPTEWNITSPKSHFEGNYTVTTSGTHYMYVTDSSGKDAHIVHSGINVWSITKTKAVGVNKINVVEIDRDTKEELTDLGEVGDVAVNNTTIRISCDVDSHYEHLAINVNGMIYTGESLPEEGVEVEVTEDISIITTVDPKKFWVMFDNLGKGDKPDSQEIIYLHTANEPAPQTIEIGGDVYIIRGWYKNTQFKQEDMWNFESDVITDNTTLYAYWVVSIDPTIINITVPSDNYTATINLVQTYTNGTEVEWGDGNTDLCQYGSISIPHVYATAGEYQVKVKRIAGRYYLGGGAEALPVIVPITIVDSVEFSPDISTTSNYAFYGAKFENARLTRFMTTIAEGAFQNCENLNTLYSDELTTGLALPPNIVEISRRAFSGCSSLEGKLSFSDKLVILGDAAFENCSGITEVSFGKNLTNIGASLFANCFNLVITTVPNTVQSIGSLAFSGCSSITEFTIPNSVTSIGSNVFARCFNLEHVVIESGEDCSYGTGCFNGCYKLETLGPAGTNADIEYCWVTKIPNNIFNYDTGSSALVTVNLRDSIKTIGDNAFAYCEYLENITLPSALEYIGSAAFLNCFSLSSLTIPKYVEYIGNFAFVRCWGLKDLTIYSTKNTNKIESLSQTIFSGCFSVTAHVMAIPSLAETYIAFGNLWRCRASEEDMIEVDSPIWTD